MLTTLDESITEAKQQLDQARLDGSAADIHMWMSRLNARLDRKATLIRQAHAHSPT